MSEKGKEVEKSEIVEKEIKKGKMSEKGKEKEGEGDEREMIEHWIHEHPLSLVETRGGEYCYGCDDRFGGGEQAYGCNIEGCDYSNLLHEECAAMAREIRHPLHPQHTLIQIHQKWFHICYICNQSIRSIGYTCSFRDTTDDDSDSGGDDDQMRNIVRHPSHPNHELKLLKRRSSSFKCDACRSTRRGSSYMCTIDVCKYRIHERCASLPQNIQREVHPHPLSLSFQVPQEYIESGYTCALCSKCFLPNFWIYQCPLCRYIVHIMCAFNDPSDLCAFVIHLRCAQGGGMIDASYDDEQRRNIIHHHPDHGLKWLRRRCSFKCDACSTTRATGSSYTCTNDACHYWIHDTCASLPQSFNREDHHHSLSLSLRVPFEYLKYNFKCVVCHNLLRPNYWIYHCQICRYIVHVKCVFNKLPRVIENIGKDMICLPTNEVVEKLIIPFVTRQTGGGEGGTTLIPPINIPVAVIDELMKVKYKFIHHQHQLTLVSSDDQSQEEEEEEEEEEEVKYGVRSGLIYDGCITPITYNYYYMSCSECKYNLHIACFHLPNSVPSLPLHQQHDGDHHMLLQSFDKLQPWMCEYCNDCGDYMNGLFYSCEECDFKVDIKCACMPDTIYHAAHPQHLLNHVAQGELRKDINDLWRLTCAAGCDKDMGFQNCYRCCNSSCDFIVHVGCAMLPASVSSRIWDRHHPLLLTYDAILNRPGDFYCDQCETQMNPRSWMYHCRTCDISFHPKCFQTKSGKYRNMKLGQEYVIDAIHPHPLTFQLLTTKHRCHNYSWYGHRDEGFYCPLCNFFICSLCCYWKNLMENGD